jgi:hypothetical protein
MGLRVTGDQSLPVQSVSKNRVSSLRDAKNGWRRGRSLGAHCRCAKRTNPPTQMGSRKDFGATGNQSRPQMQIPAARPRQGVLSPARLIQHLHPKTDGEAA